MAQIEQSDILIGLRQLDKDNDKHWTEDGQPSLAVLSTIIKRTDLKRKFIVEAAPLFNRDRARAGYDPGNIFPTEETAPPEEKKALDTPTVEAAPPVDPEGDDSTGDKKTEEPAEANPVRPNIETELRSVESTLNEVDNRITQLNRQRDDLKVKADELAMEAAVGREPIHETIGGYLAQQQAIRERRSGNKAAQREFNEKFQPASALDQAFALRKARSVRVPGGLPAKRD